MAENKQKCFVMTPDTLKKYEEFKSKEGLSSDMDTFAKLVNYGLMMTSQSLVPVEVASEAQDKLAKAMFEVGRLQGLLEEYQKVKNKGFFKRFFWALQANK
ncbi:MAG: hypothetical protein ACP5PO_03385 [Desulfurella sp.]|jgi:hypothetical protein|uniref:hypothetical protein n=1 Tax=Desulfurella sp. TaxID=1962857 RepID=UPI000CCA1452|nr:hypothetical protein [Desulfurella sp.]PMP92852.1 MAG: hypothetical protein C0173_01665 [Desulfurella sp.]